MARIIPFEKPLAEGVAALILAIQRDEFKIAICLDDQPDLQDIEGFYRQGHGNFWVALERDEIIGTVGLLDIGRDRGVLRKMFVRSDHRGPRHHTASRLLATLIDWCRNHGLSHVYLGTTAQFLAAHRFYEKNGFTEIARHELPEEFPVMTVDSRFFSRTLTPRIESMPAERGRRPPHAGI